MKKRELTHREVVSLTHGWGHNESADSIGKRLGLSRSTVYRVAEELGLDTRHPEKRCKSRYYVKPWVPVRGSPLVRKLFQIMADNGVGLREVSRGCGVVRESIGTWRQGITPKLLNFEAALNFLGYELVIQRRK